MHQGFTMAAKVSQENNPGCGPGPGLPSAPPGNIIWQIAITKQTKCPFILIDTCQLYFLSYFSIQLLSRLKSWCITNIFQNNIWLHMKLHQTHDLVTFLTRFENIFRKELKYLFHHFKLKLRFIGYRFTIYSYNILFTFFRALQWHMVVDFSHTSAPGIIISLLSACSNLHTRNNG